MGRYRQIYGYSEMYGDIGLYIYIYVYGDIKVIEVWGDKGRYKQI